MVNYIKGSYVAPLCLREIKRREQTTYERSIDKSELSFENGRPDFTIHVGESEIYIIEVKIWDSNHHFSQYKERLGDNVNGHLGYIANYTINKEELSEEDKQAFENACADGKTVKTWKEFIHKLERYQAFNDPMIRSYLDYVRAVCPFDDFSLSPSTSVYGVFLV